MSKFFEGSTVSGAVGPIGPQGATGTIGATGPTGPQGATGVLGPGVSGFFISNGGASLGLFQNINLQAGLIGTTGANNTVNINGMNDFVQVGITGIGFTGSLQLASGAMVQWNTETTKLGTLGHTTVGTAAGWITVNKSAYYNINNGINFTGLPSGVTVQIQQFLGATGGNGRLGFGSGTPIAQSMQYMSAPVATGVYTADKSYTVYIPSGTSIETYINYFGPAGSGGGSPVFMSPTGTFFEMRSVGA